MKRALSRWIPNIVTAIGMIIGFFLVREFQEKDDFETRLGQLETQEARDEEFQEWVKLTLIEIKEDIKDLRNEREN